MKPTSGIASSNKPALIFRLFSDHAWRRWGIWSIVIVAAAVWTTFVALRLRATYAIESEFSIHKAQAAGIERELRTNLDAMGARVKELEETVYAELEPRSRQNVPKTPAELWQRRRDEEIRKRLSALEQWRMREKGQEP